MGVQYQMLDSGCCGMAGSFGFAKDKYEISVDIGERVLLPAVRQALLVADGFSCREQIAQLTGRTALHTAELLSLAMKEPIASQTDPGDQIARRQQRQKKSMLKAAAALGFAAVAGCAILFAAKK
jgi:hypothetical protein